MRAVGSPEGIGGAELADRLAQQAARYEVEMLTAVSVSDVSGDGGSVCVTTSTGQHHGRRRARGYRLHVPPYRGPR